MTLVMAYSDGNVSPYELIVILHRGQDLPVAEFITSDPYVLFLHNGEIIARFSLHEIHY